MFYSAFELLFQKYILSRAVGDCKGMLLVIPALVNGSCLLYTSSPDGGQIQLISRFDNLGKGSSGAAVQCMNLMLGLDETEGLAL